MFEASPELKALLRGGDQTAPTPFKASPELKALLSGPEQPTPAKEQPSDDWFQGRNKFFKLLDMLNTPQQMLFGSISAASRGGDILQGARQGRQQNIQGAELLESLGVPPGPKVRGMLPTGHVLPEFGLRSAAGLGLDIVADPINIIPFKWLASTAVKGVKLLGETTGITRTLLKRLPSVVGEKAVFDKLARAGESKLRGRTGYIKREKTRFEGRIEDIAEQHGLTPEQVGKRIVEVKEMKSDLAKAIPDVELPQPSIDDLRINFFKAFRREGVTDPDTINDFVRVVDDINTSRPMSAILEYPDIIDEARRLGTSLDDVIQREWAAGMNTPALQDAKLDYFTHLLTKEAREKLMKGGGDELKQYGKHWSARHASQLARNEGWRGLGVNQINDLAQQAKLPGYEGIYFEKFFDDNPALVEAVRLLRGERAIAEASVLVDAAKRLGKTMDDPIVHAAVQSSPESYAQLAITKSQDSRVQRLATALKPYVFDVDTAKHIDSYIDNTYHGMGKTNAFLNLYDEALRAFKVTTLIPFPAYHARNFAGNLWNNFLAGMWDMKYYSQAMHFQALRHQNKLTETVRLGGNRISVGDMESMLYDHDMLSKFESFIELSPKQAKRAAALTPAIAAKTVAQKAAAPFKFYFNRMLDFGNFVENNARIAHFMWAMDKGLDEVKAGLSVKDYLFDYDNLTRFEKSVMRRVIPFYSWTRNNLPLQLKHLVTTPRKFNYLGDVINTVERGNVKPDERTEYLLEDWAKKQGAIKVRTDTQGRPEFFLLSSWLPAADVLKLDEPLDAIVDLMSPFIKLPIELYSNYSMYQNRPIEERFPGEQEKFLGIEMRKKWAHALKNIRILSEVDRYLAAYGRYTGQPRITTRTGEDIYPAIVRGLFGIKTYPLNKEDALRAKMFERRRLLVKRLREARGGREYNVPVLDELIQEQMPPRSYDYDPQNDILQEQ